MYKDSRGREKMGKHSKKLHDVASSKAQDLYAKADKWIFCYCASMLGKCKYMLCMIK